MANFRVWFSERKALENKYKKWIKENNIPDTRYNLITFLETMNLLDVEKVKKFLEGVDMESWDINKSENVKTPEEVINFLNEIDNISKKYNLSISHEDCHGAFIIEKYDGYNIKWLKDCRLNLKTEVD